MTNAQRNQNTIDVLGLLKQPRVQFGVILIISSYYCALSTSVVLDDAFIYFRVVENFLHTGTPVFNSGDNYFVVTSPLWTFLLATGKFLFHTLELEVLAKFLWIIFLMLASFFAYKTFSPFLNRWAILTPCIFFLSPAIGSMMGNEIALLYAAMFGMVWSLTKNNPILTGIFLGTGYLARGEFILFIIPAIVYFIVSYRDRADRIKAALQFFITVFSIAAPIILLWHLYYWFAFHHFFPDTLHVKMIQGASGYWPLFYQNIWGAIVWILNGHLYLLLFAAIGAFRQYKIFGLMALCALLHSLLYTWLKIPFYHWYYHTSITVGVIPIDYVSSEIRGRNIPGGPCLRESIELP